MLLLQHKIIIIKRVGGNFVGQRDVYGIDCDDVFMGVYLPPNLSSCKH